MKYRFIGTAILALALTSHLADAAGSDPVRARMMSTPARVAQISLGVADFLVRPLQKLLQQPQLVHDLERRGMDGVAPEIPEKIAVLFQYGHGNAGAREEKAARQSRRPATHNDDAHARNAAQDDWGSRADHN